MSLLNDIKHQWRTGGMLMRLLIINVGIFLLVWAVELLGWLFNLKGIGGLVLEQLMGTSDLSKLVRRPWSPITYMFTHHAPMHLFWNMIMLWFSGRVFEDLLGGKRLLGNYLLGGLTGFLFYALGGFMPAHLGLASHGPILGASAAVMGVFIGIASYRPDFRFNLILLGPVKLKYIAIVVLVLDLIAIRSGSNTGGHLAHLGGALYGYVASLQLRMGNDWSMGFTNWLERLQGLFKPGRRAKMRVERPASSKRKRPRNRGADLEKKRRQDKIDAILDKISRSGYDSLTKEERDYLFNHGKHI